MTSVPVLVHIIVAIARKGIGLQLAIQPLIQAEPSTITWPVSGSVGALQSSFSSCSGTKDEVPAGWPSCRKGKRTDVH